MLSEEEYHDILYQINQSPSEISNNTRKKLRKRLKEHDYASKYIPFEPLPHIPFFINRTTNEPILRQIIQAATTSNEFILDTESINIYKIGNEPALIQLQIILSHDYSLALIIELSHLPSVNHTGFTLIKELLRISFSLDKIVYIWGSKEELIPFLSLGLFSREQINHIRSINLQNNFKRFWNEQHSHRSNSSSSTSNDCICEQCLGKKANELWSLQDAVAYELKQYLSKQLTVADFNIGLDSNLYHMNQEEQNHRQQLSKYALDDCFSMHTIIINMKNKKFKFNFEFTKQIPYDFMESISSSDDDDELIFSQLTPSIERLENVQTLNIIKPEQLTSSSTCENYNWKITSTNDNQSTNQHQSPTEQSQSARENEDRYEHEGEHRYAREDQSICEHQPEHHQQKLSAEQRKRIHNKRCTRRQRNRYYKHEIIVKNIDPRFQPKEIKDILKHKKISFYAVNFSTCSTTHERTLFIGIRDEQNLSSYEREVGHLFTSSHFRQFQHMKQQIKYHHRNNQRRHHQSSHQHRHHQSSHQPRHQKSSNHHRYQHSSNHHLHQQSSNQNHHQK